MSGCLAGSVRCPYLRLGISSDVAAPLCTASLTRNFDFLSGCFCGSVHCRFSSTWRFLRYGLSFTARAGPHFSGYHPFQDIVRRLEAVERCCIPSPPPSFSKDHQASPSYRSHGVVSGVSYVGEPLAPAYASLGRLNVVSPAASSGQP